jgi:YggT family protein
MDSIPAMIFDIVINVATILIFLRFIMQLAAVDYYNPVVQSTVQATRLVDTFGRILPTLFGGRLNTAALVLIILLRLIQIMGLSYLNGQPLYPAQVIVFAFIHPQDGLIFDLLTFCRYLIFGSIILSWVTAFTNARSPFIDVVWQLAEPLLAPFRKILPNTGPIDFSPIVAFLAIMIAERLMDSAAQTLLASI